MIPLFKEKDKDNQYYYENGNWIKCDERKIENLWLTWVMNRENRSVRECDDYGYTIFGYKVSEGAN